MPWAIAGALGTFLAVFVVWAAVVEDPLGGEPIVRVASAPAAAKPDETAAKPNPESETKGEPKPGTATPDPKQGAAEPAKTPPPGMQTVTIIDGGTGTRQEVLVPSQGGPRAAIDSKLLETTRHGQVPRVALDGTRPLAAYARPAAEKSADPKMPRIALVVTGLGISSSATADALKLPGAVSLAFAPYGSDLDAVASRARGEGHEILLQVPMEPFDYPDNDPGPQTLLTSLAPEQ